MFGLCNIDAFVYENPYMLNLGFMVSNESINFNNKLKKLENMNNFEYQNLMFQTMNNSKKRYLESYKMVNFDIEKLIYEYEINNDKDFYLYFPTMFNNGHKSSVDIYLNNKLIGTYTTTSRNVIHIKNSFKNEKVKIKLKLNDGGIAGIPFLYYLNDQYFIEDVKKLQEKQLDITYFSDTYIKGNINATKDNNIMFLSIPYEDGWHVYVDGKEAKKELLYNIFIGVKLKEGKHEIEMKYKTPGLMIGIIISSISLVMVIIYSKLISKKIN